MKSMTGFGKSQKNTPIGIVSAELITVNHRNLDIRLKLPESCHFLEIALRAEIKAFLKRGHVEGTIKINPDDTRLSPEIILNQTAAKAFYKEAEDFCETLGLRVPEDISWILSKPEVWQPPELPESETIKSAILPVFKEALKKLQNSRETEGAELKRFFEQKLEEIDLILREIDQLKSTLPHLAREALEKRLRELSFDPSINADRLAQEITYLAQRSDITEEFSRLVSHLSAFRNKLQRDDVKGRALDFIIQEMNREVNTMGSKSISYELSSLTIQLKEILNQMREQVQNVE